jgi:hypothetical protein
VAQRAAVQVMLRNGVSVAMGGKVKIGIDPSLAGGLRR